MTTPPELDNSVRQTVITAVLRRVQDHYVFPDRTLAIATAIEEQRTRGIYDRLIDGQGLAEALTTHLQAAARDQHLRVIYFADAQPPSDNMWADPAFLTRYWAAARLDNHGWSKAERLAGNIGYLAIHAIEEAEETAETIAAALGFLTHTSALILDVREGRGGSPSGIAFLCSYFVSPTPVHLNDLYYRQNNRIEQYWTLPHVPGHRYRDQPLYVLTSAETFSGCEELAYNLQNLRRATLVGETTAGGANPVDLFQITDRFAVMVPTCRAVSPITGTNWEGVGVTPDLAVPATAALATAHQAALQRTLEQLRQNPPPRMRGPNLLDEVTEALAEYAASDQ